MSGYSGKGIENVGKTFIELNALSKGRYGLGLSFRTTDSSYHHITLTARDIRSNTFSEVTYSQIYYVLIVDCVGRRTCHQWWKTVVCYVKSRFRSISEVKPLGGDTVFAPSCIRVYLALSEQVYLVYNENSSLGLCLDNIIFHMNFQRDSEGFSESFLRDGIMWRRKC